MQAFRDTAFRSVRPVAILIAAAAVLAASSGLTQAAGFRTPTDNIHCMADVWDGTAELRCDIRSNDAAVPKRPADCDLDYGNAFVVTGAARRAVRACVGDTVMDPSNPVIDYGSTWKQHGFTCKVESAGVTCANRHGNGFFLSRKKQTLE